jgi:hypothetical protein
MKGKKPKGKGVAVIIAIGGKPKGDMKKYGTMPVKKGRFQMGDSYHHAPMMGGGNYQHDALVGYGASKLGGEKVPPPPVKDLMQNNVDGSGADMFIDALEAEESRGRGKQDLKRIAGEQVDMEYLRRTQPHLFTRKPSDFASGGAGQSMRDTESRGVRSILDDPDEGPQSFYGAGTDLNQYMDEEPPVDYGEESKNPPVELEGAKRRGDNRQIKVERNRAKRIMNDPNKKWKGNRQSPSKLTTNDDDTVAMSEDGPMSFAWSILKAGAGITPYCDRCGAKGLPLQTVNTNAFAGPKRLCPSCYEDHLVSRMPQPSYGGDSEGSYMVNPGDSHM